MLKIQNLTKHYKGSDKGVTNLSLHVEAGDIFAFIGHNGAGKTTTLKCVVGIHDFEQGEITINGLSMKEQPHECKKQFAYIPDNPHCIGMCNHNAEERRTGSASAFRPGCTHRKSPAYVLGAVFDRIRPRKILLR